MEVERETERWMEGERQTEKQRQRGSYQSKGEDSAGSQREDEDESDEGSHFETLLQSLDLIFFSVQGSEQKSEIKRRKKQISTAVVPASEGGTA